MIENILAFARGETGRLPLNPRPLSLSQAIDDTVADMAPMLARHGARIDCRLDPAIDVFADAGAVRQVLVNLIDNALRYGPPHQTITMLTEREGNHALLSVVDDGPGIAPAAQSLAWLPFTRLHPDGAGTGLGLPLVRRLAEAMGGSATFGAPLQGKAGLRVDVRLPLARAPRSQPAHPPVPVAS
jgi:signal transduction histidine kinase